MSVTAQQVKALRERSGAGMMECKKALVECGGDLEAAAEHLRKAGLAKADKKAGRVAAEGVIELAEDERQAVLVEVNCETDFVARDDSFKKFATGVATAALQVEGDNPGALLAHTGDEGKSLEQLRQELIAVIGENIQVRRLARLPKAGVTVGHYLHGTRIGSLVAIEGGDASVARDLAMHIAAFAPAWIDAGDVPGEVLDKEREILKAQAAESGKPPEIIEKMVGGRLRKYIDEITLYGQPFVKDNDVTVGKWLKQQNVTVKRFVRLAVGEGVEKEESDFAAEVMSQAR